MHGLRNRISTAAGQRSDAPGASPWGLSPKASMRGSKGDASSGSTLRGSKGDKFDGLEVQVASSAGTGAAHLSEWSAPPDSPARPELFLGHRGPRAQASSSSRRWNFQRMGSMHFSTASSSLHSTSTDERATRDTRGERGPHLSWPYRVPTPSMREDSQP